MKLAIDLIKVDEAVRIRKDVGNLKPLEESIAKVGLINPVLIDEQSNLVAGFRRLEACRNLGFKEVEVKIVEFEGDQLKMLDAEVAENFFRKDFTPEEILATEKRRQEIIEANRPKGWFERFWLWLKELFAPKAKEQQATPEPSHQSREAAPAAGGAADERHPVQPVSDTPAPAEGVPAAAADDSPAEEAGAVDESAKPESESGGEQTAVAEESTAPAKSPSADETPPSEPQSTEVKREEKQAAGPKHDTATVFPGAPEAERNIPWRTS